MTKKRRINDVLEYVKRGLAEGKNMADIMVVGGAQHLALTVQVDEVDDLGIVARPKGMMGGIGEPQCHPWACISKFAFR
jgi:hypothetical protein